MSENRGDPFYGYSILLDTAQWVEMFEEMDKARMNSFYCAAMPFPKELEELQPQAPPPPQSK